MRKVVILGTAHLITTPGKQSPDGRLREPVYTREIIPLIVQGLQELGYLVYVDYMPLEPNAEMQSSNWSSQQSRELNYRVRFVNSLCARYGRQNCIYVSVHVNASPPNDGRWHKASGWSVFVAPNASQDSRILARMLYEEAFSRGLKGNRNVPVEKYWEGNFKVLRETKCPAVLTENLFQDNEADVEYLLLPFGKRTIARVHIQAIDKFLKQKI